MDDGGRAIRLKAQKTAQHGAFSKYSFFGILKTSLQTAILHILTAYEFA